ncbi:MAG TPA: DUF979 domain-containing protein [Novosphingobium sp.]|nr:DUF979 domain-containing protein [Novosphingobium sp.]HNN55598.1 DUF979 domain-containing protein [Novosphingobium sp.]
MIGLAQVYLLAGLAFAAFALLSARDGTNPRRWINTAFWGLLALSMLAGDRLGDLGNGVLVLALVGLAARGLERGAQGSDAEARQAEAARHGNRLFLLALVIPLVALGGTLGFKHWPGLVDPKQVTLVSLSLGVVLALAIGLAWLRPRPTEPLEEGRRLMDAVGWAAILPQMLASLGAVFALAGVGEVVGQLASALIPEGSRFGAVLAYGLGMALFTMVMGNAFAAFPVMAAAIGLPLLIHQYHGDPAVVAAIGMLAGFCGTLMTPMAANFNVVPAALLDLADRNAVVKAQVPTALPLLAVNIALIWFLAFP